MKEDKKREDLSDKIKIALDKAIQKVIAETKQKTPIWKSPIKKAISKKSPPTIYKLFFLLQSLTFNHTLIIKLMAKPIIVAVSTNETERFAPVSFRIKK